jgi:signal transduction histidine kinase/CheY-like chemotaxis protein
MTKSGIQIPVETRVSHGVWDGQPAFFGISKDLTKPELSEEEFSKIFQTNTLVCGTSDMESQGNLFAAAHDFTMLKHADGQERWVSALGEFDFDTSGKPVRLIGTIQDITERKKMIQALNEALAKADSGDHLKTAFLNNISHEIRTPLNGLLGFSRLITEPDITNDEREHCCTNIQACSDRLLNTITNYLDISLIVSGNIEITRESFNLLPFFEALNSHYQPLCESQGVGLRLDIPENARRLMIHSDPHLLRKIFSHLLDNAVKFTKQGEIAFGFKIMPEFLEFFVRDTGAGIKKDALNRVFERFMQEDDSVSRSYEGSGLGLSITQGLVKLLGGEIRVESSKGAGSLFSFNLQCHRSELEFELPEAAEPNVSIIEKTLILIAEDDESNYLYLQWILRKAQVNLLWARNGREAVNYCRTHPEISLVLMDLKMPVMDGFLATRAIKSFRKSLPVIALTAFSMNNEKKRALETGCNDYIVKPVSRELLYETLKKCGVII